MQLDAKTNHIIINYVLEYYQKSRKTKIAVPQNMWEVITKHINVLLQVKHQQNCDMSDLNQMKSDILYAYFERSLIAQLGRVGLSEDELFTLAYPHVDVFRNIEIVFISNRSTTFNIPDETLQMLIQIIKYCLNRYTFDYEIWDLFEKLYCTGIRKLEINVANSLFGLNPEEKRQLILHSQKERTRARLLARINANSKSNSSLDAPQESSDTNIQSNTDLTNVVEIGRDSISTPHVPNTTTDNHANQPVVEDVIMAEPVNLQLHEKDVNPSGIGAMVIVPNPVIQPPVEDERSSESTQPLSSEIDFNTEKKIICERHTKAKSVEPLVHWSLLFELYEKDTC